MSKKVLTILSLGLRMFLQTQLTKTDMKGMARQLVDVNAIFQHSDNLQKVSTEICNKFKEIP